MGCDYYINTVAKVKYNSYEVSTMTIQQEKVYFDCFSYNTIEDSVSDDTHNLPGDFYIYKSGIWKDDIENLEDLKSSIAEWIDLSIDYMDKIHSIKISYEIEPN